MKRTIPVFIFLSMLVPMISYADPVSVAGQDPVSVSKVPTLTNPLKGVGSVSELAFKVVNLVVDIGYVLIAFFLLLSGFKFVTAQGSDSKLEEAKHTFYYTIIGALIIIGAKTIVTVVEGIISGLK